MSLVVISKLCFLLLWFRSLAGKVTPPIWYQWFDIIVVSLTILQSVLSFALDFYLEILCFSPIYGLLSFLFQSFRSCKKITNFFAFFQKKVTYLFLVFLLWSNRIFSHGVVDGRADRVICLGRFAFKKKDTFWPEFDNGVHCCPNEPIKFVCPPLDC